MEESAKVNAIPRPLGSDTLSGPAHPAPGSESKGVKPAGSVPVQATSSFPRPAMT